MEAMLLRTTYCTSLKHSSGSCDQHDMLLKGGLLPVLVIYMNKYNILKAMINISKLFTSQETFCLCFPYISAVSHSLLQQTEFHGCVT